MWSKEFFKVDRNIAMDILMGKKAEFIINSLVDGLPVKSLENGCDVILFVTSLQDLCSTVLDVLKHLQATTRDPDEEGIAVVQPR